MVVAFLDILLSILRHQNHYQNIELEVLLLSLPCDHWQAVSAISLLSLLQVGVMERNIATSVLLWTFVLVCGTTHEKK